MHDLSRQNESLSAPNLNFQNGTSNPGEYNEFASLLNSINRRNFAEVLIKFLRKGLHLITLDDFYNFLYKSRTPENTVRGEMDGNELNPEIPSESREVLELCNKILGKLMTPNNYSSSTSILKDWKQALSTNMFDILRIFLMIKIILDSVKVVDEDSQSKCILPRAAIYKSYYIICVRLIRKYSNSPNLLELQNKIIISNTQFGKYFRLIFPNLEPRRLGKRGNSKYSYHGVTWNNFLIDEEIKRLAGFSLQDFQNEFGGLLQTSQISRQLQNQNSLMLENLEPTVGITSNTSFRSLLLATKKPLYSFVDLSNTLPGCYCSLRVWKITVGKLPEQSQWSKETMEKSIHALEQYDIDVKPLLLTVQREGFSAEYIDWFLEDTLQKMHLLEGAFFCAEAFLHYYLIVALFLSPIVFASDEEIHANFKPQLSMSLIKFVTRLETEFNGISPLNHNSLMSFAKIIRKMISAIKLLLSRVKTPLAKLIVRVLGYDRQVTMDALLAKAVQRETSEVVHRALITACNALNWEFVDESLRGDPQFQRSFIQRMAALYLSFYEKAMRLSEIRVCTAEDTEQQSCELPHQIFSELLRIFHEVFMSDPFVLQLPMKLIELIINSAINEFQNAAFNSVGSLDPELSKDTFKCWWVFSTAVQEHLSIFSEVVALSLRIS